ncbi:MAG: DeoR/GlpR family DNA-binding transcription regulator [Lachnospiraceae bacterium]|nr:DeoR/GlpR family DNA-binding transcription regulator [Lachnospiraceae bacterium]
MLAVERQNMILNYLEENQIATTKKLSEQTGASLATLRRDLNYMNQQGLLKKTHGGAQALPAAALDASAASIGSIAPVKTDPFLLYKDMIAKRAAEFICPNDIVFIGAGLTCNLLCKYINESHKQNITVVTTNITAVLELASNPDISTLLLGGNVHAGTNHIETLDEYTVASLEKLYFDKVFFTVDGIDLDYGYSIINRAQLPLYHHLLRNSKSCYLLASEGKYDKRTFTHLGSLDAIPNIIANSSIEKRYLSYYNEHNINIYTT